jgi:hypothetical protein
VTVFKVKVDALIMKSGLWSECLQKYVLNHFWRCGFRTASDVDLSQIRNTNFHR